LKEELLHFIWKYKLFSIEIKTISNEKIEVVKTGFLNTNEGPDFLMASVKIGNLIWNGNIEIHVNASDWEKHNHSQHPQYQNIILHIVYNNDKEISFLNEKNIPTLELKNYISKSIFENYNVLFNLSNSFIPCEKIVEKNKENLKIDSFFERLYIAKLERNYSQIQEDLKATNQNWEGVLFHRIAYTFGLKVNANVFLNIAKSEDYQIIKKLQKNKLQLESFLFGKANLLSDFDNYSNNLKNEFDFIQNKFSLDKHSFSVNFLRLRPQNFPTIRLSQLADLYFQYQNLFSCVVGTKSLANFYTMFSEIKASDYWDTHYVFGKVSEKSISKKISKAQIDLLIINAILPIKYAYQRSINEHSDDIFDILREMKSEKNTIITQFSELKIDAKNALESQAIIELYNKYCNEKRCLDCEIGYKILNNK